MTVVVVTGVDGAIDDDVPGVKEQTDAVGRGKRASGVAETKAKFMMG